MTDYQTYPTKTAARAAALEMRSTGWPEAQAQRIDTWDDDGRRVCIHVVATAPRQHTYLREDGYCR